MSQNGQRGPAPDPAAGVFSTMLVSGGAPVALEDHLARLEASVRELYDEPLPVEARGLVAETAPTLELGRLRVDVRPGGAASVRSAAVDPALVFPDHDHGTDLAVYEVEGWNGAHKWADRRLLEAADAELAPALPLLVEDGQVLEGSRANLFAATGGRLVTPPTDGRILPGVARARLIEVARAAGIEVEERPLEVDELAAADEAFLTSGVRGVEPVRSLTGVARWDSGELTARVGAELRRAWLGPDIPPRLR